MQSCSPQHCALESTKAFLMPPPPQQRAQCDARAPLVDDLLRAVDGTDGGVSATAEHAILKQIEQLEARGGQAVRRRREPVSRRHRRLRGPGFVQSSQRRWWPFSPTVGRTIFRGGEFQHLAPDRAAENLLRLFGLFDGAAVLTGKVKRAAPAARRGTPRDAERVQAHEGARAARAGLAARPAAVFASGRRAAPSPRC